MELYLDSANLTEIKQAFQLGFINGLTTTPTFMQKEGIADVDSTIKELSKIVPVLQIEALGNNAAEIVKEAERLLSLGLDIKKTVFKIPVSLEGVHACYLLRQKGMLVNVHLVYTLQQAYMAMQAGATYVCPLVGRLQDQGHDALALVKQCVDAVDHYKYNTKIMFSSVRNVEHVRNAINLGAHTITVPYKILAALTENTFTTIGTEQFIMDTRLMTVKVKDVMKKVNPTVLENVVLKEAIIKMTEYGFGSVTVVDTAGKLKGIFTDSDLRKLLQVNGQPVLEKKLGDVCHANPLTIDANALLNEAALKFKETSVDTLLVIENNQPIGMLDIQDI
jgi:transaldolase